MNSFFLQSIFTATALIATTGLATATGITEIKTYQSTISTDAQGALDLKMEVNYNDAVSNAPVMVMTHQYSESPDLFNHVRPNAQQLRDQGFFVISVAMRGRMSSDGVRDSGGLEIHDIFDAVEAAKAQYGGLINPENISIAGYSGGGGNVMSALTKFPDYFRTGGAFYGMSDYGHDANNGWYNNGAAGNHKAQLDTDVGNPNTPTALITSRYMARASNLSSRNNPYSEIHFFVNSDEPTCPPVNDTSYRNNAIAAASFAGEFNKITIHTGTAGTYQDFNGNSVNEANEQQYWPHTTLTPDQQASGQSWYLSRVLDGSIPAPMLNASDDLFVAGFVRTKKFSFFIGDGQSGAGSLLYTLSAGTKTFTFDLQSTYPATGKLTVDTADMNGQTVNVLRNGVLSATFPGGGTYEVTGIADNETVRLTVAGAPTTSEIQLLSGADKDNTVPWDFRVSAGRNAGVWTTIPVPSCWETKGFGSYEYGGINTSEYGEYKKAFNVPADWADKRVFLVFEGSMTDTEPRINGLAPGSAGTVPAPNPLSNERALDNRAATSMGQAGGIAASASGNLNLGTLSSFTLACWVKPETDFSTMPDGRFPRLVLLGADAGYDGGGDGAYLSVYNSGANTRALQFKVPGVDLISSPNVLSGNDWTFVAVTYDSTLGANQVKFYVGNRAGALGSPVSTGGSSGGPVPFGGSASACFMNRSNDRSRAFDGLGDDFRIFSGALSQAQLETVRGSGLDAAVTPPAPLYHWNFNNAATGTTATPVTGAGGGLTLQNSAGSATDLYSPIDGGVSSVTLSNERALDNRASTSMGQGGGVAASTSGDINLGTLTSFTVACWVKPEADFSAMTDGRFPRLMLLGANANYNGDAANGVYLSAYNSGANTRTLQFKINNDGSNGVIGSPNVLSGSDWTFVAATYDSTLGSNQVKLYVGNRTGALAAPVTTATYGAGAAVQFGANGYAYLLNRSARDRTFDGLGDDFRIFNGALTQAQLDTVRASGLGTSATPPTPLYQWSFNNASSGTTVTPVVGTGGVLTLQNSAGTATDLYSPVGDGVSGSGLITVPATVVHQGAFYEFSYDVTNKLNFGASNQLDVTVRKVSANASVNDAERTADYWVFGGIYRPVYLEARPATHIERVAVDAKADGQIAVHSFLSGVTSPLTVAARVTDMNEVALGTEFTQAVAAGATSTVLSATLPTPNPWSPEFPNLYKLVVEIRDGATVLHSRTETIGFRTIGFVASSGFTLNGKKIVMRGVNRHEFWPTDGRTTSRAVSIADIELMKSLNMNAVRMSHYPPSKHFLEECDRLGLLVLDELAGWQGAYDNAIGPDLVREMVIRDVNHPCIFVWANGNEGGSNGSLDDDFALWDPQNRKVLHPANWPDETGGVRTHHYANYTTFLSYLGAGQSVYMPTEMQHGLFDGGGGAGLADHWDAMLTAPNGGGMFIWALLDEGLVRDDQSGAIDTAGSNAPDGIVGPYREKEASYYTVKALWSPVQITAPNPATFTGSLAVENRFDFTNLNQCTFHWDLGWFPDPADSTAVQNSGFIVGKSSTNFAGPSIVPGTAGTLALGLPANLASFDALRVSAKDPFGKEIYTWTWPLHTVAQVRDRLVKVSATTTASLTPSVVGNELSVTNGTRVWRFNLTTGRLNGVTVSGQPVSLSNGPRPVTGSWATSGVTHGFDGADYLVTMNNVTSAADGFQWRIQPNGWVNLKYRYTLTGTQKWLGITFDYPEANVTSMRWLGQGPYRVWKNRLEGQEIGVNYKVANNTVNGTQWGFPEFRGYHGQLHWAQLGTSQQPITLTTNTSNLFLRVLTPALTPPNDTGRTSVNPAFPAGNLSLLHAINAIGNKFQNPGATTTGPSSADTTASGLYEGEADFYFGALPDPGVDRDKNNLSDSWELQNFNTLGNDPDADPDGDGLKLILENAFDLSPSVPDANSSRLPHSAVPGTNSPAEMGYSVPLVRLNEFSFVPEISDSLEDWFDSVAHPDYFQIRTSDVPDERQFAIEHGPAWPGDTDALFQRLRIQRK